MFKESRYLTVVNTVNYSSTPSLSKLKNMLCHN